MTAIVRRPPLRFSSDRIPIRTSRLPVLLNGLALSCGLGLLFALGTGGTSIHQGGIASQTVVAHHNVPYIDHTATRAKRQAAMQAVAPVFRTDRRLAQAHRHDAELFFRRAASIIDGGMTPGQKLAAIQKLVPYGMPADGFQQLAALTPANFRMVQTRALSLLSQAMAWSFDSNQKMSTEIGLVSTIPPQVPTDQRTAISEALSTFLPATSVPNEAATSVARRAAAAAVPDVVSTVYGGEVVIRRGDFITPVVIDKLTALGLKSTHTGWKDIAAGVLFAALMVTTLFWYLTAFHPGIVANARLLIFIDVSLLLAVAATRLLAPTHVLLPFFLPVASAATFAAVVIAPEACIAIALAMAVLAGWVVTNSFELTMYYFLSSTAGVLAIRQIQQLKQFILAAFSITIFGLVTVVAFGIVDQGYDLAAIEEYVAAAGCNGILSATLALGGVAVLSDVLGITTMLRLLELGQPSQPLLRRLMVRAPGTYNHSLIVSTMAERAADMVGANALQAKVAALYHDVGKSVNPHCFIENQMGIGNIHDELSPSESVHIIRGHVTHGLRLAKQYKLPRICNEGIAEHHGTMQIGFFLRQAQRQPGGDTVDIADFYYPGPRPQSKETALLMLADGCESAVRASHDHSSQSIRDVVRSIFEDRIENDQLTESPLTLGDLEKAQEVFCSVLNGLYHPRIEYPEMPEIILETTPIMSLESHQPSGRA